MRSSNGGRIHEREPLWRRPEFTTDVIQILKTVVAAAAAWWIAVTLLESSLPFLAPWTALLTVHATVHRSLVRGVQTMVASVLGVALSFLIGHFLGVSLWSFALAILIGVAAARLSWLREEGIAIATTAIFVLGSGFGEQAPLLIDRIFEVAVGVGAGVLVNLVIVPPLRERQAARYVDNVNERMGKVLVSVAEEFSRSWETDKADAWFEECESIASELDSAWEVVYFARESRRGNPRMRSGAFRSTVRVGTPKDSRSLAGYEDILSRANEGVSHLLHLARTLREATQGHKNWDERFRSQWAHIVGDTGRAISDPDADVSPLYDRLTDLSATMAKNEEIDPMSWTLYGSLITSVRHIVVVVDDVASSRNARERT
jgi:hypothetical protein